MKALVVTIFDISQNYGNKLQNYAVIKILNKLGIDTVETFTNGRKEFNYKYLLEYSIAKVTGFRIVKSPERWKNTFKKKILFEQFNKEYLSPVNGKIENLNNRYDYFAAGSDQIWNPGWINEKNKDLYLLNFCEKRKKITVAPSFGVDKFPQDMCATFKEALLGIENISVREDRGAEFVFEICGKTAAVLIDPTLMLSQKEWLEIKKEPKFDYKSFKYILVNFLAGMSSETKRFIDELSQENNLQIIDLQDVSKPAYITGPCEFIELIDCASLVLTDSFHTCAFSILFNKPFIAFPRNGSEDNMQSRIGCLLKKLGLQDRSKKNIEKKDILKTNYETAYETLDQEREKMKDFLLLSFKDKNAAF